MLFWRTKTTRTKHFIVKIEELGNCGTEVKSPERVKHDFCRPCTEVDLEQKLFTFRLLKIYINVDSLWVKVITGGAFTPTGGVILFVCSYARITHIDIFS